MNSLLNFHFYDLWAMVICFFSSPLPGWQTDELLSLRSLSGSSNIANGCKSKILLLFHWNDHIGSLLHKSYLLFIGPNFLFRLVTRSVELPHIWEDITISISSMTVWIHQSINKHLLGAYCVLLQCIWKGFRGLQLVFGLWILLYCAHIQEHERLHFPV